MSDEGLHPGEEWIQTLETALRESNAIVLLISSDSVRRPDLFFEIGAALGLGKPIVFVRSQDLNLSDVPAAFRRRKLLVMRSPEATAEDVVRAVAA